MVLRIFVINKNERGELGLTKEEFIKEMILNKSGDLKKFATETDISYTTLVTILKNSINRASVDNVIKIANGLNTTVEGLNSLYQKAIDENSNSDTVKETASIYMSYTQLKSLQIPFYGDIAAGALATMNAITADEVSFIPIPELFLGKQGSEELIAFQVNGESMNMVIPDGSTVVAKKIAPSQVKDGEIVIFSHDGQYSMKRIRRDEQDEVLIFSPESTNKKFRDTVIPYSTENDLKIYAKVIWYGVTL